ncbi:MAG: polysaccharide deacetylase family protein [Rhizobacter sp.]|nr:polysaccharide deacetylase family protein [Chlorobiales bacterium]
MVLVTAALISAALAAVADAQPKSNETRTREVCITFDDLPSGPDSDVKTLARFTAKLLQAIKSNRVPATGFVNEGKLYHAGETDARIAVLKQWTDAGIELGNHTFSHKHFFDISVDEQKSEVIRGETVTILLQKKRPQFFRHPYLCTGQDSAGKAQFETFLTAQGYLAAPVTMDNSEWMFGFVYTDASKRGDKAAMQKIAAAYLQYIETVAEFYESFSRELLGREMKHILLLHASLLNADCFEQVIEIFKRRGYTFISLQAALEDAAYQLPDAYIGARGISWLQRWRITKGLSPKPEPPVPAFVEAAWRVRTK